MLKQGNYISAKTIVERVFRDVDYAEQLVDFYDCLEWIWEVIELTNIPTNYVDRECEIDIKDYRGPLPSDFNSVIQVRNADTLVPCILNTHIFYKSPNTSTTTGNEAHVNDPGGSVIISSDTASGYEQGEQIRVKIENGYIYTDKNECTLEMAYKAFLVDNTGFPMILEDMYLIRTLTNYIIWKIDYKAWRRQMVSDKIYQTSEQEYLFAVKALESQSKMPDLDMMESMRKRSNTLVKDNNHYNKSFKYIGG